MSLTNASENRQESLRSQSSELFSRARVLPFLLRTAYLAAEFLGCIPAFVSLRPDNLNPSILGAGLKEDDWHDVFIAYAPTKNLSITGAYAGLGKIVPAIQPNRQAGFCLSGQVSF
jgi:hypothetical protein